MHAFMTVFTDELLWGETDGFRTVDHSKDVSDPERVFWLKVVLLFWVGDYPGLGKCAAMKHAGAHGCHWCEGFFYAHSPGHNVCIHNRRNLRANHPYRTDNRWGPPEELSIKFRHIHLAALYPNEFWRLAEETGAFERVPKKPSTITPLLVILTDELLFWQDGVSVTDYSKAVGDPARVFTMRAILLFWCGDYPGLGEASGFGHSGTWPCHWCKIKGEWQFGVGREAYGGYVRCLFLLLHDNLFSFCD